MMWHDVVFGLLPTSRLTLDPKELARRLGGENTLSPTELDRYKAKLCAYCAPRYAYVSLPVTLDNDSVILGEMNGRTQALTVKKNDITQGMVKETNDEAKVSVAEENSKAKVPPAEENNKAKVLVAEENTLAQQSKSSNLVLTSQHLVRHLKGCSSVFLLGVTLGEGVDRFIASRTALSVTEGFIFDALASALVDGLMDTLHHAVRCNLPLSPVDALSDGVSPDDTSPCLLDGGLPDGASFNDEPFPTKEVCLRSRFSPGYGDLSLACQGELLKRLDAHRTLGVSILPSFLMVPSKTITAMTGGCHVKT